MLPNFKFRTLILAMTMTTIPSVSAADAGSCYDITASPVIREGKGIVCSCTESSTIQIGLGLDVGGMTIRPGTSALGGGPAPVCYQVSIYAEAVATVKLGTTATVAPAFAKSTIVYSYCDKSNCGSALFGLFKWGGAHCLAQSSKMGEDMPSWKATGTCDCDPTDPRS